MTYEDFDNCLIVLIFTWHPNYTFDRGTATAWLHKKSTAPSFMKATISVFNGNLNENTGYDFSPVMLF